jgi:hypothetical protein
MHSLLLAQRFSKTAAAANDLKTAHRQESTFTGRVTAYGR